MAYTIDWDGVSTHVGDHVIPTIVDQIFKTNATMYRLRPKAKIFQGGRSIVQPLSFAPEGGGGQWWSGTDRADMRIRNPFTAAQFYAKNYELPIVISQDEEDTVTGPKEIMSLIESKTTVARRTVMDAIGGINGLFNDATNPKAITGLQWSLQDGTSGVVQPAASTYGGISRSATTNTWWNHQVDHTGYNTGLGGTYLQAAAGAFTLWDKMLSAQALASGKSSTLILCNWGVWNEISSLVNSRTTWFRPQQNEAMHKAGFKTFMYRDITIVVDEQVPRVGTIEHVYFIDEDAMDLWVHTKRNFSFTGFKEGFDQFIRAAFIQFRGELTFSERRSSGVHSNVDTAATS